MEIVRTWFGSDLAWVTPALVLLGMLVPWNPQRNEQNWAIVAVLTVPFLVTWVFCWFVYNFLLAILCLLLLGLAFVGLGRVLRMIWSEMRL